MTTTWPAPKCTITTESCPHWCEGHADDAPHSRDLPGTWGSTADGPVLGLALEQDGEGPCRGPRISVQLSRDGLLIDEATSLGLAAAEDYATSILHLVRIGRRTA